MNSESLLNILEIGLGVGVVGIDADLNINHWNRWMEKNTGIHAENCLGKSLTDLFPDIRERKKEIHITSCIRTSRPVLMSPLLHHYLIPIDATRDKEKIRMFQHVRIFPLDKRDAGGAVIIIEDMTEPILHEKEVHRLNAILKGLKNIYLAIAESEHESELYRKVCMTLIRDTDYLCAMIGRVGIDEIVEEAFCRSADDTEGKDHRCFSGPNFDVFTPILSRSKSHLVFEKRHHYQSFLHCASCPHRDRGKSMVLLPLTNDGDVVGILAIASQTNLSRQQDELDLLKTIAKDVSFALTSIRGRKKYKKTVKHLQEYRSEVAVMRQREKTEALLREKQAQIVQSGRLALLGEMGTGIAHELNQPLTIIRLTAEKLLFDMTKGICDPSKNGESLDRIIKSVDRAAGIIRHMRDFGMKSPENPEMMDPSGPVNSALSFFMEQFRNHNITLETNIQSGVPAIWSDAKQIEQILVNLLSNAKYAVDKKGNEKHEGYQKKVAVSVSCNEYGNHVVFEVADNGPGLTPTEMECCSDPFFTTKEVGDGTGLGLYIVSGIIRGLKGKIEIESEEGEGARFRIVLPVHKDIAMDDPLTDVGRELSNIGIGEAADALSKMIKKRVTIVQTDLSVVHGDDTKEIFSHLPASFAAVSQSFSGPFTGKALLCFPKESFQTMLEEVSEGEPDPATQTEILGEIGNIIIGSFMTAIGTAVGECVRFEMPEAVLDFRTEKIGSLLPKTGKIIEYENQIAIQEIRLSAHLLAFIESEDYEKIAVALLNRIQ